MTTQVIAASSISSLMDSSAAHKVLTDAIARHAPVTVRVEGAGFALECHGMLIDEDGDSIGIRLERVDESVRNLCGEQRPIVAFDANETRYVFESAGTIAWQGLSNAIRLPRPNHLALADRRRSERRRLKQPAAVTIQVGIGNNTWATQGAMLNLSPEGIACSIAGIDSSRMEVGSVVSVRFRLKESYRPFEWSARVTNITEGATAGRTVVGFEFIVGQNQEEDRARLCRVLDAQRSSMHE